MEVQYNEKEAIICCCSSHYNIDEQYLHPGTQEYISAVHGKKLQEVNGAQKSYSRIEK